MRIHTALQAQAQQCRKGEVTSFHSLYIRVCTAGIKRQLPHKNS
jgi:hypothetical protein